MAKKQDKTTVNLTVDISHHVLNMLKKPKKKPQEIIIKTRFMNWITILFQTGLLILNTLIQKNRFQNEP